MSNKIYTFEGTELIRIKNIDSFGKSRWLCKDCFFMKLYTGKDKDALDIVKQYDSTVVVTNCVIIDKLYPDVNLVFPCLTKHISYIFVEIANKPKKADG